MVTDFNFRLNNVIANFCRFFFPFANVRRSTKWHWVFETWKWYEPCTIFSNNFFVEILNWCMFEKYLTLWRFLKMQNTHKFLEFLRIFNGKSQYSKHHGISPFCVGLFPTQCNYAHRDIDYKTVALHTEKKSWICDKNFFFLNQEKCWLTEATFLRNPSISPLFLEKCNWNQGKKIYGRQIQQPPCMYILFFCSPFCLSVSKTTYKISKNILVCFSLKTD